MKHVRRGTKAVYSKNKAASHLTKAYTKYQLALIKKKKKQL